MTFKGYKRNIKLEFDYKEVKEGVPNVTKQMGILNAEFKKSSAEAYASGKEVDKLGTRYDYLSNKIKIQQVEVEEYREKLEKATNAEGQSAKAIENNTAELQKAEARLGQTKAQLDQVTKELEKQKTVLGKTSEEWKVLGEKTTSIGKDLSLKLTAPIMAAGIASFKLGADFEQALGKMDVVFERNSEEVKKWSKNALRDFGLAQSTAATMASDFGALFKGMGISLRETEEWSKTLTERTMDLANFYDTTVEETTNALNAIVTGQTQPLRRFGINMTQATLQEYALSKGIKKKVADMTEAEKVQLRYNFVIERTNIAVGTTAREADTATGQMNRFKEGVKELGVQFSEHILPIFIPVIEGMNKMTEGFAGMSDGTKKFIVIAGGLIASIGPVLIMLGSVFGAVSKISEGMKVAKGAIEGVSKVGSAIGGLLSATGAWGFKEWAIAIAGVVALLITLFALLDAMFNKGQGIDRMVGKISGAFKDMGSAVQGANQRGSNISRQYVDGSHRTGLPRVPRDGYIAELHQNEEVLRADDPRNQNNNKGSGGDTYQLNVNMNEVDDVYKLVNVFKEFKQVKRGGFVNG